eukprot:CAMPEP_0195004468 /NCGR_PEP_ID=MMETSP0326_2-20130528/4544_1 /TAXON_ID=2866 ORGANISM="Crypthecodinium cohnii, Strain Seligo" /NCGR_SAMPLE_ID=MMETSP0326_2 /ASSEMBLY_ACC=CAM_ASM_000348 /LENGTH=54 /DNA_ID=CAMNT_0040009593 /DNA_START=377 /DNA_END=539 /DNA_ORIENTATION=-
MVGQGGQALEAVAASADSQPGLAWPGLTFVMRRVCERATGRSMTLASHLVTHAV